MNIFLKSLFLLSSLNTLANNPIKDNISLEDTSILSKKAGRVYYSFDHKLENEKRCLSYYFKQDETDGNGRTFIQTEFDKKIGELLKDYIVEDDRYLYGYNGLAVNVLLLNELKLSPNCIDTINCTGFIPLPRKKNLREMGLPIPVTLAEYFLNRDSRKIYSQEIHFNLNFYFNSKDSYTVVFKRFELVTLYTQEGSSFLADLGSETTTSFDEFAVELEKDSTDEKNIKLLTDLNNLLIGLDKTIEESFEECFTLDELD